MPKFYQKADCKSKDFAVGESGKRRAHTEMNDTHGAETIIITKDKKESNATYSPRNE
jgi:hypothetical protein